LMLTANMKFAVNLLANENKKTVSLPGRGRVSEAHDADASLLVFHDDQIYKSYARKPDYTSSTY